MTGLFHFPIAILAVQILAVDLVGEMLPLTFLTWDPPDKDLMKDPPRNQHEHVLNKKSLFYFAWSGLLMGSLAYLNFYLLFLREGSSPALVSVDDPLYMRATTLTYITIVISQWFNILSQRTANNESVATSYILSNKRLWLGYLISLFLLMNISYNPFISEYLRTGPITLTDWGFALAVGIIYLLIKEMVKFRKRIISAAAVKAAA
jgi:Ca2+-transporting ATPase